MAPRSPTFGAPRRSRRITSRVRATSFEAVSLSSIFLPKSWASSGSRISSMYASMVLSVSRMVTPVLRE